MDNFVEWLDPKTIESGTAEEELKRPEIIYLLNDMKEFHDGKNYTLKFDRVIQYAAIMLYSGHRHRCKVYVENDDEFCEYLKYKGYDASNKYSEGEIFEFIVMFDNEDIPRMSNLPYFLLDNGYPFVKCTKDRIEIKWNRLEIVGKGRSIL